jgi:N-acetylglucosamine-6-phosphate deacetylase
MRIHARHYQTGKPVEILCEGGVIRAVECPSSSMADYQAGWVAPALFDLQINGCEGRSFNSETLRLEDIRRVVAMCRRHGIGSFCPTLVTGSFAALAHGMRTLASACASDAQVAAAVAGIHLEGPYLSPEDGPRGAHPRAHIRPPDWQEFCRLQEAAEGRIRLVTLAPEHDGALRFIERAVQAGVVIALGHTAADGRRIRDAISAGARLSTHLGNGSHAILPRHDNYVWEQLAADELWASIICDGHHLPPAVMRCILRVKTPARIILTCDAGSLAGLLPGRYREWDQELEVSPEGKIVVPGTSYLAGSWTFTDHCVETVMRLGEVSLADALDMAGARPRELLRLPPRTLEPEFPADLVLFDWQAGGNFEVKATVVGGEIQPADGA